MAPRPNLSVYVADDGRAAIIAPMHQNFAGIYYEQDEPLVVINWRDPLLLGMNIHSAAGRFTVVDRNLKDSNKSDWPAFKVSGAKTIRAFEREYLRLGVAAVNEAAHWFEARVQPRGESDIELRVSFPIHGESISTGRLVLKLIDAATRWRT